MINKMIDGIVRQIRQSYGEEKYEIYTEAVKQSLKEPCFSVLCLNPSLRRKLGPRFLKTVPFIIRYWPKSDNCYGEGMEVLEDFNVEENEEQERSNDTYMLDFENKRILRKSDEEDEILRQAIIKILLTEFDYYSIYENYGLEKADLLGENIAEVKEVIGGRIEEAILRDERFNSVEIESISNYKSELMVSLTVTTSDDEEIEVEGVSIDV